MLIDYLYLFFVAFMSATIFPMGSEALVVYDYIHGYNFWLILLFATLGNTLGSGVNYWFGMKGEEYILSKKIITQKQIESGKKYFDKYGGYALYLSWVPIIGDPIVLIAGALKYNIKKFFMIVSIAKFMRYYILLFAVNN